MITLSDTQYSAFAALNFDTFVDRAMVVLARTWPRTVAQAGMVATRQRTQNLVRAAIARQFTQPQDILRFVNVAYALGDDFEEQHPWAQTTLARRDLAATFRIELLVGQTTDWLAGYTVE